MTPSSRRAIELHGRAVYEALGLYVDVVVRYDLANANEARLIYKRLTALLKAQQVFA